MKQIAIDFTAAHASRDAGMQQAIQHAERVDDGWPDRAYQFIWLFARWNEFFTVEELTAEARRLGYGSPTDDRAWGSIIRKAARADVIRRTGMTKPRLKGHASPGPVWQSLVFGGSAA